MARAVSGSRTRTVVTSAACLAVLAGAACVIPTAPSTGPLPILGACGLLPNYADSTIADEQPGRLLRWRVFPVRVYVDTGDRPPALARAYRDAVVRGAAIWDVAMAGAAGPFEHVETPGQARAVIRFDSGPPAAATTTEDAGRVIVRSTTAISRPERDGELVGRGLASQVIDLAAQFVGHEMGHALGILLHSPDSRDLMARVLRVGGAGHALTAADRHTFQQAYCH